MMSEKIIPSCRYDHGSLKKLDGLWAFMGVDIDKTAVTNARAYTAEIYRCPVCGYLEFFDDAVHYE